jgi:uncharacterized membrane protein
LTPDSNNRQRIESIDLVRGLVIIVMALDHTRDFFGDLAADPTALSATTPALFFTRWITHICAPAFFLLAGTGACLAGARLSKRDLSRYLVGRGFWLIFLELVVMRFALQFNIDYQVTIVTVLWALGWAMIALAGMIWLPAWAIAAIGVAMVAGHNLLDGISASSFGNWAPLWSVLHTPGIVLNNGRSVAVISYVLIPWVGVTALGYLLGRTYRWEASRRKALLLRLGVGAVLAFVLLRWSNLYGDPSSWSPQASPLWTAISFLNVAKYPPSLLFLLMTLGPVLLLLRAFEDRVPDNIRPALIIGKVPLFFFVLHFFLIHLLAVAASGLRYGMVGEVFRSPDLGHFPFSQPSGWDAGLPAIYTLWLAVVLMMFPLCRWYARVKQRRKDWWLGYL